MQKDAHLVELEKCCQTHIFFAKFRFDTAENEPAKNVQNFAKKIKIKKIVNFAPNPTLPSRYRGATAAGHLSAQQAAQMNGCRAGTDVRGRWPILLTCAPSHFSSSSSKCNWNLPPTLSILFADLLALSPHNRNAA